MNTQFDWRRAIPERGSWPPKWWPLARDILVVAAGVGAGMMLASAGLGGMGSGLILASAGTGILVAKVINP